ncbi:MAG: hypothetical protein WCC26_01020 [Terracidiphilus sp.]
MNEDSNLAIPPERPSRIPQDDLARFVDELLDGNIFRAGAAAEERFRLSPARIAACPDPGQWIALATEKPGSLAIGLWSHAALCGQCLPRLRSAQWVLHPSASPEEQSELSQLACMSAQWQHRMSVELAHTPYQARVRRGSLFGLCASAAAAAMLVLVVFGLAVWHRNHAPERLLASAYSENRIFDLRVPGAGYAALSPEREVRGIQTPHTGKSLATARAQIEQKLEGGSSDPHWLQLEARAAILGERYDDAIVILDKLVAAGPLTESLLLDTGSAYFLRGTVVGSEDDRAKALDYLRRADEMSPGNSVVLFNEAIMMQDRGQWEQAVDTWKRYLQCEADPQWQADGQRRMLSLEDRINGLKLHPSPPQVQGTP